VPYVFDHLALIREALRRAPFGLITDIDGTISPTAPTPQQAEVTPLCRGYLAALSGQLALVAAVSGRAVSQVRSMLGIEGMVYIGNHGLEWWRGGQAEFIRGARDYLGVVQQALEELAPLVSGEGIIIENKGVTASIHYRLSPDRESARQHILAMVARAPRAQGLRVAPERMAVGLLPPLAAGKGTATLEMIGEYGLRGAIYLGDDLTDVDAFEAIHNAGRKRDFRGLAIGVTSPEMPERLVEEADFTLNGVADVERFLQWLAQTAAGLD